jgi:ferredoxin
MKIIVDLKKCELHGQCVFLAPDYFRIEDDQLIWTTEASSADREKLIRTAKACPQRAILLED